MTRSLRARKTRPAPISKDASESAEEDAPKSPRKQAKRIKEDKGYNHGHDATSSSQTPVTDKTRTGRVGKLAQLPHMPLDVLFEIFASLPPLDLLRLTRTNKTLRGLLMARGSRQIWVAALATVPDCPPVPEGMTEPAWVHLAFEHACHTCNAKNVKHVLWAARIRTCSKCIENHPDLISVSTILRGNEYDDALVRESLIPWESGVGNCRSEQFTRLEKMIVVHNILKALPLGSPERQRFVTECQQKREAILQHVTECEKWSSRNTNQRSEDLDAARQRRRQAIEARLVDIDPEYKKDLEWLPTLRHQSWEHRERFEDLKCMKQPKDLTDRMWLNCKAEIIAFLEPVRPLRQADDWLRTLEARVTLFSGLLAELCPSNVIAPCVMDLNSRLDIRAILERPLDDNGENTVDRTSFVDVLADFDAILKYARAQRIATLLAALRAKSNTPQAITEADLDRPTCLFRCTGSNCEVDVMNSATALVHRCETYRVDDYDEEFSTAEWRMTEPMERMQHVCVHVVQLAGGQATFEMDSEAIGCAEMAMTLAGIDPIHTTISDIDSVDPWFSCSCTSCTPAKRGFHTKKAVFSWRQLVEHGHYGIETYSLLSKEERSLAIKAHKVFKPPLNKTVGSASRIYGSMTTSCFQAIWACGHCGKSPLSMSVLEDHVRATHKVEGDFQLDIDYKPSPHCLAPPAGYYSIKTGQPDQPKASSTAVSNT